MAGAQDAPKHNATARQWIEFSRQPTSLTDYLDIHNSQAMWFELTNLIMGAEGHLSLAKGVQGTRTLPRAAI